MNDAAERLRAFYAYRERDLRGPVPPRTDPHPRLDYDRTPILVVTKEDADEALAAADAHRKYLDIAATNGEIGLLLVETQTALAALVAAWDAYIGDYTLREGPMPDALAAARAIIEQLHR
jgi:hypothetical protein